MFNKRNVTHGVSQSVSVATQSKVECVSFHVLETGFCFSSSGGSTGGSRDSPRVSASLHNLDLRVFGAKNFGKFVIANFTGRLELGRFAVLKPRAPRKVCAVEATRGVIVTASKGGTSRGGVRSPPRLPI